MTEYERMKTAEQRLKIRHEIQAKKDENNPDFDANVKIEYNVNSADSKDSDDEDPSNINLRTDKVDDSERIQLSENEVDKIKSLMLDMPKLNNVPVWADKVPEDVWKTKLLNSLERDIGGNEVESKAGDVGYIDEQGGNAQKSKSDNNEKKSSNLKKKKTDNKNNKGHHKNNGSRNKNSKRKQKKSKKKGQ